VDIFDYENQLGAMLHIAELILSLSYTIFFCLLKIVCREHPQWVNFCEIVTLRNATKAVSLVYRLCAMPNWLCAILHSVASPLTAMTHRAEFFVNIFYPDSALCHTAQSHDSIANAQKLTHRGSSIFVAESWLSVMPQSVESPLHAIWHSVELW
jgi:hypothetical protein